MSTSQKDKDIPKSASPRKGEYGEGNESPEKQLVPKSSEKPNRRRKRKITSDSSEACDDCGEEALIDQAIEEKLQEVARKNNLSQIEMKRILRKLVGNEHVLALVKLQEEEAESQEDLDSSPEKFTRAKARALNQKPIPLPALNETEPEPAVAALISQDLHSDEEDEEYHPHDEDLVSDDDPNTTISDIDSQPATPSWPTTPQKDSTPVHYSQDGLFKLPRDRCDSLCSQSSQHEEIIAKRTRSKLCLQTTPIETIESTFIPPDITKDMYDLDTDMDHAWKEFLNEFTKPLNTTATVEEDDEADPEYVAADKVPIDREELRDVNISKKELNDLIAELFDGLVSSEAINQEDVTLETPKKTWDKTNEKSPIKKKQKVNEVPGDADGQNNTNDLSLNSSNVLLSTNSTQFDPNIMSTPQPGYRYPDRNENTNVNDQRNGPAPFQNYQQLSQPLSCLPAPLPIQTPSVVSHTNSSVSHGGGVLAIPTQAYSSQNSHSTLQLLPLQGPHLGAFLAFPIAGGTNPIPAVPCQITFPTNNSTNSPFITFSAPYNRGTPQIVETIDITQSPEKKSSASISALSPKSNNQESLQGSLQPISSYPEPALPQSTTTGSRSTGPTKKKKRPSAYSNLCFYQYDKWRNDIYVSINKYMRTEYAQKYEALKYETADTPQISEDQKGFTELQLRIFQQQLQIFVQFAIQNFFQTYSHPELWKLASGQKEILLDLQKKIEGKDSEQFYPSNLTAGVKLIKEWEEELSVNSDENRKMMDFLYEEIEKIKATPNNYTAIMRFPPRIMKRLLSSPAILYPDLLPKIPFRFNVLIPYHEFAPAEDFLIAIGLERYLAQIEQDEIKHPRYKTKVARLRIVCERIARDITVGKSPRRILYRVNTQSQSEHYNPIKFYNERKKAPPAKHELRPVNLTNPQTPQERISELPLLWKEFATMPLDIASESQTPDQSQAEAFTPLRETQPKCVEETNISSTVNNSANQSANNNITSANIIVHFNYLFDGTRPRPLNSFQVVADAGPSGSLKQSPVNDVLLRHLESLGPLVNSVIGSSQSGALDVSEIINSLKFSQIKDNFSGSCSDQTANPDGTSPPQQCLEIEPPAQSKDCLDLVPKGQKRLTDYFPVESICPSQNLKDGVTNVKHMRLRRKAIKSSRVKRLSKLSARRNYRIRPSGTDENRRLKIKLCLLVKCYYKRLQRIRTKYKNEHVNRVHVYFKSLELYTGLLSKLKMNCKKVKGNMGTEDISAKRAKLNNEAANTSKNRKSVRTNEYLKRMVTPESQDEINKKDAIYALNFYDKVEETLKKDGKMESFRKFQSILKLFDPQKDEVSEMYNKIEKIFIPDYPELAEIFLTFLLPGEAAQVGKFFEHFILANMTTFISKLNLYFSKQPAQIRKVYSALSELSADSDVNMDKIKEKILPLLKGNQFLTEWFLQNFSSETPPDRLTSVTEHINYKTLEIPRTVERECEHVSSDELTSDANDDTRCQLKYLNGRIFYGSKILLPAKLAFLADDVPLEDFEECSNTDSDEDKQKEDSKMCVHGIRDFAEKCLKRASDSSDEPEKFDEIPEVSEPSTKYIVCDNATLKAHATRLNPSLYASEKDRRTASPKKSLKMSLPIACKEKRKSPKKSILKSPGSKRSPNGQSGGSLDGTSKAIGTAKRLKALIEDSDGDDQSRIETNDKQKGDDKSITEEDLEEELEDGEIDDNSSDSDDAQKSYADPLLMVEIKSTPWTRDEDKIILEEVKCGFDNEEILIKKLSENLPHRTESEIMHRHQFLMDVLNQLQSKG